jgi:putative hydrolase of the HAD superfamily
VGLRTHLTHFLTSSELGVSKPDPGFFEEVSRVLGVPPTTILAVGNDYVKDIVPARAVGMITILVSSEEESAPREAADLIVPSLTDLPDLVGALLE